MKKVALSLLAFALAGGMVSAQAALKLSGSLNTGTKTEMVGGKSDSYVWGDDAGVAYGRLRFDGAYDAGNTGLNFRFESSGKFDDANIKVKNVYAWAKFLDKTVTVKAGFVDDGSVSTSGDQGKDIDPKGLWVSYTGVPGLVAAAAWAMPIAAGTYQTLDLAAQAKYTVDKVVTVQAGLLTGDFKPRTLNLGVGVLAVDGLTLGVDAVLGGLDAAKATGTTTVSEKASFKMDALSINFLGYQYLYGADTAKVAADSKKPTVKEAAPVGFYVRPSVAYTLDPITSVEVFVKYTQGAITATTANDVTLLEPKAVATFTLDSKAKVLIGGGVNMYLGDKDYFNFGTTDKDQMKYFWTADFRYSF